MFTMLANFDIHVLQLVGIQKKQTSKEKLLDNIIKYTPSRSTGNVKGSILTSGIQK